MKSIEIKNQIRPWSSGEETNFLPKELDNDYKCTVAWCGESKPKEDGKSTVSAAIDVFEGTNKLGRFWCDATVIGKLKEDGKFHYKEEFIGTIKGGKLLQAKSVKKVVVDDDEE